VTEQTSTSTPEHWARRFFPIYGILFSNVPDYNGSQVQVDRIVIDE